MVRVHLELEMLSESEIEFGKLDLETLDKIVNQVDDQFIKTSALTEIKTRDPKEAIKISLGILKSGMGDKYLQAQSLSILMQLDREVGVNFLLDSIDTCDKYTLYTVVNLIVDEIEIFEKDDQFGEMYIKIRERIVRGDIDEYDDELLKVAFSKLI